MGLLNACSPESVNDLEKAEWLLGIWENKSAEGISYESWRRISNREYAGKSYTVQNGDTVIFESIRLVQEPRGLWYIPAVKDQNKGLPVRFKGKSVSETEAVFENPEHDFPQIISYKKIGANALEAEISGTLQGKEQKQTFRMKRVK